MRIAINGFGRIGKTFLRTILQDPHAKKKLEVVVVNIGPARPDFTAHLFKYDTLMGIYPAQVSIEKNILHINNEKIAVIAETDAKKINWKQYNIDWVVDATGHYTSGDKAKEHLQSGAKKVLITAPAKGEDVSIIPGVNLEKYDAQKHHIVSLGSCTTNAFLPMLQVMHENFGIDSGFMTTVHAYTNSQVLLDVPGKDLRRSRAAALNIIPSTTGASEMVAKVIPELGGKITAASLRVPVGKGSLIDLVVNVQKKVSAEQINQAFAAAAEKSLKNILYITKDPLVSSDFHGSPASVTIDTLLTKTQGTMAKVNGWYDNEWGYSERLKDFLLYVENK